MKPTIRRKNIKVKITREIEVEIAPNVYLNGADLSDANLSGANLRNTDFSDADLGYANLKGAKISDLDQLTKVLGVVVHK